MSKSTYFKDKHNIIAWSAGLFLNALIWVLLAWRIFPLEGQIILHYNIYFGTDRLGPAWQALYLPALGLVIIIVNFLVGYFYPVRTPPTPVGGIGENRSRRSNAASARSNGVYWPKNKLISYIFNYLSVFVHLLLIIAAVLLVLVNL